MLRVVLVLLLHHSFRFFICHCLSILLIFDVGTDQTLIYALLHEVWLERVIIDAEGDDLLHSHGLPVGKRSIYVRCTVMVTRHCVPIRPLLVQFFLVVLVDVQVSFFCHLADSRCPHKYRHDLMTTYPALVPLIRVDTPLGHAVHELLVPKVSLNDKLL